MTTVVSSLSSKIGQLCIIAALVIGILATIAHITYDALHSIEAVEDSVSRVKQSVTIPVIESGVDFNKTDATHLLNKFLSQEDVYEAAILMSDGTPFASVSMQPEASASKWTTDLVLGETHELSVPVTWTQDGTTSSGSLRIVVDTHRIGQDFMDRAAFVLVLSILSNSMLAMFLYAFSYRLAAQPVLQLSDAVSSIVLNDNRNTGVAVPSNHSDDEIGYLIGVVNDLLRALDDQHEEKDRARDRLQSATDSLRTFFDLPAVPIVIFRGHGLLEDSEVINANAEACRFFQGKGAAVSALDTPTLLASVETPERLIDALNLRAEQGEEIRCVSAEGKIRHFAPRAHFTTYFDTPATVVTFNDVTDLDEGLDPVIRGSSSIDRSNMQKHELFVSMSGEIRRPLNTIIGYADLMTGLTFQDQPDDAQQSTEVVERYHTYINHIARAGHELNIMLTRILETSWTSSLPSSSERSIDVSSCFEAALDQVRQRTQNAGIQIDLKIEEDLPELRGDVMRVRQLLGIVLDGALMNAASGKTVEIRGGLTSPRRIFLSFSFEGLRADAPASYEPAGSRASPARSADRHTASLNIEPEIAETLERARMLATQFEAEFSIVPRSRRTIKVSIIFPADRTIYLDMGGPGRNDEDRTIQTNYQGLLR